jgi:hypothetical protein
VDLTILSHTQTGLGLNICPLAIDLRTLAHGTERATNRVSVSQHHMPLSNVARRRLRHDSSQTGAYGVKSNCILFALKRWFSHGGYIVLRKSNYGWWPHMIWTKDFVTFEEFTPPVHYDVTFPPLLFKGIIKITNVKQQVAKGLIRKTGMATAKRVAALELIVKAAGSRS